MSFLAALTFSAITLAQTVQAGPRPTGATTIRVGQEDTVTFRFSGDVVTDIDLHVHGGDYTVPLQCAGGLHEVHFDTVVVLSSLGDVGKAEGSFALLFDVGSEQDRRFGELPRVQISFSRRRFTAMLMTNRTGERSRFSSKLCATVPVGAVACKDTRQLQGLAPGALVEQLRGLTAPIPAHPVGHPTVGDPERLRERIYEELLDWGTRSVPALVAGLEDSDVRLRRNVALALGALSGGWWTFECGPAKVDVRAALPALVVALRDADSKVRMWTAEVIGSLGAAAAAAAVPALTRLVGDSDEGARCSACAALGRVGAPAKTALPALRTALSDKSEAVRRQAAVAIQLIQP